jgi:hypothetical protein
MINNGNFFNNNILISFNLIIILLLFLLDIKMLRNCNLYNISLLAQMLVKSYIRFFLCCFTISMIYQIYFIVIITIITN